MTYPVKTYKIVMPIYDTLADDDAAMVAVRARVAEDWRENCVAAGGRPIEEPTVEEQPNLQYGWPLYDERGEPMLDELGEHATNRLKLYLLATGRAVVGEEREAS